MTISEEEIEETLRAAPKPKPPQELRERLISQIRAPRPNDVPVQARLQPAGGLSAWLRRWWPAFAPAAASLACAVGIGVQHSEISELRQSLEVMESRLVSLPINGATPIGTGVQSASVTDTAAQTQQEIARLKELVATLSAEVARLEQTRVENEGLKARLAKPSSQYLSAEEADMMAKAQERAENIRCVNNLKQLGLAVRVWSLDNGNTNPPNILDMTNEMSTPVILWCPGDHARQMVRDFKSYTPANCSYEYLAPDGSDADPQRVLFRCPIHGNIGLCDGSVQSGVAKRHPEQLVERDGKLYYDQSVRANPAPVSNPDESNQ